MPIIQEFNPLAPLGFDKVNRLTAGASLTGFSTLTGNNTFQGINTFKGDTIFSATVTFEVGFSSSGTVILSGSTTITSANITDLNVSNLSISGDITTTGNITANVILATDSLKASGNATISGSITLATGQTVDTIATAVTTSNTSIATLSAILNKINSADTTLLAGTKSASFTNLKITTQLNLSGNATLSGSITAPNISYDNSTSGLSATALKTAIDELDINRTYLTAGTVSEPSYLDNGDGTVTIGQSTVRFYDNVNFTGKLKEYTVSSATITATNDLTALTYIFADYNGGTPITNSSNSVSDVNGATTIPLFTLARSGTNICRLKWNNIGLGYSSKAFEKDTEINRFAISEGLALGETGTRNITVSEGKVWYGTHNASLTAIDTSLTSCQTCLVYHTATGGWTTSTVSSSYNNTQYDTNTGLTTLTANRYAVNWVYRDIDENSKRVCVLLGQGNYTLANAEISTAPNPPASVSGVCELVGRIIVKKSATAAKTIQQVATTTFTNSQVTNHNDLNNIELATTGVTYGHINATTQTIYGNKTFNDNIVISGSLTVNSTAYFTANVGIGTSTPTSDSILDITSTTKGVLMPRMTTTQRVAITTPSDGLVVYDTDLSAFFKGDGSNWIQGL